MSSMPAISTNNKLLNLSTRKLYLVGPNTLEIDFGKHKTAIQKKTFCLTELKNYYESNPEKYTNADDFINLVSRNYTHIELETRRGRILGARINSNFIKLLRTMFKAQEIMEMMRKKNSQC